MGYRTYRTYDVGGAVSYIVKDYNPDCALVQAGKPIPIIKKLIDSGIKTAMYVRDVDFEALGGELVFSQDPIYISNSNFTANMLYEKFKISSIIVPPLVAKTRYITNSTRKNVLFINPVKVKGLDIALQLATMNPEMPFMFVEGWPLRSQDWRSLQEKLSGLRNVKLLHATNDMRRLYRHAKLVLIPSQCKEAWGRIATEAHFSGIPALASDIGGLPESVGPGGLLIKPDADISDWNVALRRMWHDNYLYSELSTASYEYASRKEITPDTLMHSIVTILAH